MTYAVKEIVLAGFALMSRSFVDFSSAYNQNALLLALLSSLVHSAVTVADPSTEDSPPSITEAHLDQ